MDAAGVWYLAIVALVLMVMAWMAWEERNK